MQHEDSSASLLIEDLVDIMLEIEKTSDDEARKRAVESFTTFSERLHQGLSLLMKNPTLAAFFAAGLRDAKTNEEPLQSQFALTDQQMADIYEYGISFFQDAKYEEAGSIMMCLCMLNPFIGGFWRALGLSMEGEKDYKAAVLSYAVALEKDDNLEPALFTARALSHLGFRSEAIATVEEAVRIAKETHESEVFFRQAKEIAATL